jgi:hypothetical protein
MKQFNYLCLSLVLLTSCASETPKPTTTKAMKMATTPSAQCVNNLTQPKISCANTVSATFDHKGVLWIVWSNGEHAYVQSSVDKGQTFSAAVQVNENPEKIAADGESRPKIQTDAQGRIYLTWVQSLDDKRSSYIRFSRSTDGGKHFSAPVTVNDNLEIIRHRFDSLAVGQKGEVFIAWLDARHTEAAKKAGQEFSGLSLYYAWSKDGGEHFYPNKKIADGTCECCRVASVISKDNLPVVAWRHIFSGGIRDHALVKFQDWDTPGSLTHLGQENWKIDACPHHGPGLAVAEDGTYHAVWFSHAEKKQGLFYAHSHDGNRFSTPLNFGGQGASHPHVSALGQQVAIAWQEFDGKVNRVQVMKSVDGGKRWTKPETVAQSAEKVDQPFLIHDGQQIYLSWQAQQQSYQLRPLVRH